MYYRHPISADNDANVFRTQEALFFSNGFGFSLGPASSCFIQLKIPRLLRLQFFEGYTIFCNTIFHEQTSIMFLLLEIRIRGGYKSLSHGCSFTFIIYLLLTSLHRILRPNTVINHNWICQRTFFLKRKLALFLTYISQQGFLIHSKGASGEKNSLRKKWNTKLKSALRCQQATPQKSVRSNYLIFHMLQGS